MLVSPTRCVDEEHETRTKEKKETEKYDGKCRKDILQSNVREIDRQEKAKSKKAKRVEEKIEHKDGRATANMKDGGESTLIPRIDQKSDRGSLSHLSE